MFGIPYYDLLEALKTSEFVDVDAENECLRVKGVCGEEEYKKWLFPNDDGTLGCAKWVKEPEAFIDVEAEVETETETAVETAVEVEVVATAAAATVVVDEAEAKGTVPVHLEEKKEDDTGFTVAAAADAEKEKDSENVRDSDEKTSR